MTKQRAVAELIFAGSLWGFGFVATIWGLQSFTFAELLVCRFILAFLAGELIRFFLSKYHQRPYRAPQKNELSLSIWAGILLGGLLILQTIGLKYTTATKSGFITSLYVVIVPLLSHLVLRQKASWKFYIYVMLALMGTWLLVDADLTEVNPGDLWTLACSFVAAVHILYIDRISTKIKDGLVFNNLQSLWCLLLMIPLLANQPEIRAQSPSLLSILGVISLGIGSSAVGFYIQIRSQKVLSATTASMLFLLESPFALIFGYMLLQERLSSPQAIGAAFIILASYLTIRHEQGKSVESVKP